MNGWGHTTIACSLVSLSFPAYLVADTVYPDMESFSISSNMVTITYSPQSNHYFRLLRLTSLAGMNTTIAALNFSNAAAPHFFNINLPSTSAVSFFAVESVPSLIPADSDGDIMDDLYESKYPFLDPLNASDGNADEDADLLTNAQEYEWLTNPTNSDSDADSVSDGVEVYRETDPLDANSYNVIIYADSILGDDGYKGLSPEVADNRGPKQTFPAAFAMAISGDAISMADGAYPTDESIDLTGKNLTIIPNGTVTIQPSAGLR